MMAATAHNNQAVSGQIVVEHPRGPLNYEKTVKYFPKFVFASNSLIDYFGKTVVISAQET